MRLRRTMMIALALTVMMALATCFASASTSLKAPTLQSVYKYTTSMKVSWYKVSAADGYQVQYSRNESYKNPHYRLIKDNDTLSKKITGLEKNKGYYVRVRSYINTEDGREYSKWDAGCRIIVWNKNWKYAGFSKSHSSAGVLYYTPKSKKKGKVVALNPGHGCDSSVYKLMNYCHPDKTRKVTGGSTAKGALKAAADNGGASKEASRMLSLAKKTKRKLLNEGYDVLMLRQTSGIHLDVIGRTVMANNIADCHIALHYDSTSSNKGAFYCGVPDVKKYRSMYPVSKHYKQHNNLGKSMISGFKYYGLKIWSSGNLPTDLMQTSFSTIPSTDFEVGDRGTSYSSTRTDKMAKGIVRGVNKYFD